MDIVVHTASVSIGITSVAINSKLVITTKLFGIRQAAIKRNMQVASCIKHWATCNWVKMPELRYWPCN